MTVEVNVGYFTPEQCKKIITIGEELFAACPDYRQGTERDWLFWPRDEDEWLWEKMRQLYSGTEYYRYMAINRYHADDCMIPHQDKDSYVIMTFLNDDFEGGDLIFYDDGKKFVAPKGIGNTLVYHGEIEHGVTKITKGVRYSIGQLIYTVEDYPKLTMLG